MSESSLEKTSDAEETVQFYPDHFGLELRVVVGITILIVAIGIMGLLLPVGLGAPADPLNTPAHVKPEWYFLALYQLLKYIPKTTGAVLPVIFVLIVTIWPFLDRKPETTHHARRVRAIVIIIGMILLIGLTIWGEVS